MTTTVGKRLEPTLSESRFPAGARKPAKAAGQSQNNGNGSDNDTGGAPGDYRRSPRHERRDERVQLRVALPFDVLIDGEPFPGHEISVGGFSIDSDPGLLSEDSIPVDVAIHCNGFNATIPALARQLAEIRAEPRARFSFTDIGDNELAILRKIIQAHLAGTHLTIDQLATSEDPQTVRNRVKKVPENPGPGIGWLRLLMIGGVVAILIVAFAGALFEKLYVIKPGFAAVTAPSIDIHAPIDGELAAHNLDPGQLVSRDERLVEVVDPSAQAELVLARATLNYNDRLLENLRANFESSDSEGVSFTSGGPLAGGAPVLTKLTPLETRSRIKELESTHDFAAARIEALEAQASTGAIFAPCDCLIQSIRSGEGGYWVQKGTLIAQLTKTGTEDVNVEALVHLDVIDQIQPNERAVVVLPTTGETREARVAAIQLESQNIERAGFPEWARQDMSHGSVILSMEEPISPQFVGHPVEVRFLDTSSLGGTILATIFRNVGDLYGDWFGDTERTPAAPEPEAVMPLTPDAAESGPDTVPQASDDTAPR